MAGSPQTEQIFLSYSRTNLEAAVVLRSELEKTGFTVFFDQQSIRAGDNWMERLQTALQGCVAFVVLVGARHPALGHGGNPVRPGAAFVTA